ncbi:MAG: hypothetical protein LBJ71_03850, partial [Holosporaceae bacterium]|nr:hypothetical protein [Holosporaceae bacterium]
TPQKKEEESLKLINGELLPKSVSGSVPVSISILIVKELIANFFSRHAEECAKSLKTSTIKRLIIKISDSDPNGCRLFDIAQLLILLQDCKINNGKKSRDNWNKSIIEIEKLCAQFFGQPNLLLPHSLCFLLQELLGYERLFMPKNFHKNGFPSESGLSNVDKSLSDIYLNLTNQLGKELNKSELEQFQIKMNIEFNDLARTPFSSPNSDQLTKLFVEDIYDKKDNKEEIEPIITNLFELMNNLMSTQLSIIKSLQLTNYLKAIYDLMRYMCYFSNIFSLMDSSSLEEINESFKIAIKSLAPKKEHSPEKHPFECALDSAPEILKETKDSLEEMAKKPNDQSTLNEIRKEIFYINHDLILQNNIKIYWNFLKEGMTQLGNLISKHVELQKAKKTGVKETELNKLRNEFKEFLNKIGFFLQKNCELLSETFTQNNEAIQDNQAEYLIFRGSVGFTPKDLKEELNSLDLNKKQTAELQRLFEKEIIELETAIRNKKLPPKEKKELMKEYLRNLTKQIMDIDPNGTISNAIIDKFGGQDNLLGFTANNMRLQQTLVNINRVADSLPTPKEHQAIIARAAEGYPITKNMVTISVRSTANDRDRDKKLLQPK